VVSGGLGCLNFTIPKTGKETWYESCPADDRDKSKPRTETVTPDHTFGQVLDSVIHGYQEDFPVVDESGKLVGMITRDEIMAAAHSPQRYSSVRDLMKTNIPTISPQADLFKDGLRILQQSGLRALPVTTENAELVGMLTIEDVGQASLLRPAATKEVSRIDDRATSQHTASR
jgi:CBS domain-containing protein